ncbi:MAG TPA: hypothetical protein VFV63_01640 [Ilumatobacteraceae bacterium]|nr:hypothetical protein [Ilumatobacteraceae bacterium]
MVHRVVVGATCVTVVLVVVALVVDVPVVVALVVVALVVVVDALAASGGADRLFTVAAVAAVSVVTSRALGAEVDPTSSP